MRVCGCREAKEVVKTKQGPKWKQQLKEWRENNPISNGMYGRVNQCAEEPPKCGHS